MPAEPSRAPAVQTSLTFADDYKVLQGHPRINAGAPDPVFDQDRWDLNAIYGLVNSCEGHAVIDFSRELDPVRKATQKELACAMLTKRLPGQRELPAARTVTQAVYALRKLYEFLSTYYPGLMLREVTDEVYCAFSAWLRRDGRYRLEHFNGIVKVYAYRQYLSQDRLEVPPWQGRGASDACGKARANENTTDRIPEPIISALLNWALFYVETASQDILAAIQEAPIWRWDTQPRPNERQGSWVQVLKSFLENHRKTGLGLPGSDASGRAFSTKPLQVNIPALCIMAGAPWLLGGLVQRAAVREGTAPWRMQRMVMEAAEELGLERGWFGTITAHSATGKPWRPRFGVLDVLDERRALVAACYIVVAYLSGMRDSEVQALRRGCCFVERNANGEVVRHKLRGTVFKKRSTVQEPATWVVVEPVAKAISVLEKVASSGLLFQGEKKAKKTVVGGHIRVAINRFRDHVNSLAEYCDGKPVPDYKGEPWQFTPSQFRRTVAWHIGNQPFGTVAGKIQYKHVKSTTFEGYAGRSESGFRNEIEAEKLFAVMEDVVEFYEASKRGLSSGAVGQRLEAEFARIREDLEDFPGVIADQARLRAMLLNVARKLHPGMLSDCYYDPSHALCHRYETVSAHRRPIITYCQPSRCPNAYITLRHKPLWDKAIQDAKELLDQRRLDTGQRAAIQDQIAEWQAAIAGLERT